ncbi:MAG: PIN domain-containing protein [Spirochaetaceae bacterium]|jgi:predicted nucleic acid-binding protein|nr:PIN domain-containing protein [Spirochaetaceae bacterium]
MTRKQRLYLDTSVISYLDQQDSSERMKITHIFWQKVLNDEYDIVISDVVYEELAGCDEEKRNILTEYLDRITHRKVIIGEAEKDIADCIIENGILTREKSYSDCLHIAAAITSGCNTILSWNFKHIVNPKTINGVKIVSIKSGYPEVSIYSPESFIGAEL